MKIAVVGTGYVGLVSGACLAEGGHDVCCCDVDAEKIAGLRHGRLPIYEPGLAALVKRNQAAGRLSFTTNLAEAIRERPTVFIAVGTPELPGGGADLRSFWSVVDALRQSADGPKTVVIKSTVPVGTNGRVTERLAGLHGHRVASNPEFLKEGAAVADFMNPDRIVVGIRQAELADFFAELYAPCLAGGEALLVMSPESAEMTKYAANCFLAMKISFINEVAGLCQHTGADVDEVRRGIGHDPRIGFEFLQPGPGFGGSCFPKDVRALLALSESLEMPSRLLPAIDAVNNLQKEIVFDKLSRLYGRGLCGKTVAVWGLAFKPHTDDVRESAALVLLDQLLGCNVAVRVHDPQAMGNVRRIFGERLTYCTDPYQAAEGADALAIVTDWPDYRRADWTRLRQLLARPVVVDGRNLFEPAAVAQRGFTYASVGRGTVYAATTPAACCATFDAAAPAEVLEA